MRNTLLIAKREYLEKIRGKAFRFSTILLPAGILLMLGATYFGSRNAHNGAHVAIAADTAPLANDIKRQLLEDKPGKYTVDVVAPASRQDSDNLMQLVRNKSIDGLLTLENTASGTPTATYASRSSMDFMTQGRLDSAMNQSILRQRLNASGLKSADTDALMKHVGIESLELDKDGKAGKSRGMASFSKAMTMAFLLTMPILLYGMDMARSIIEEKSSRIFEVMLAVIRPDDMLAGKLLGVGAVGLTQIAIWVVAATLFTGSALAAPLLSGDLALHFSVQEAVLFPLYYILGFFLYSSLFSGLAATCETAQELQMFMPFAVVPVWLSFGILPYLLSNPDSLWAVVLSLFPFTAPFVMLPRVGLATVPLWQFGASVAIMILSIWGVLWFSSRLYRIGILMYGKRATLPEIFRWLRYS